MRGLPDRTYADPPGPCGARCTGCHRRDVSSGRLAAGRYQRLGTYASSSAVSVGRPTLESG